MDPLPEIAALVRRALVEDLGSKGSPSAEDDVTSTVAVPADRQARARLVARQDGCLCGTEVFALAFGLLDPQARVTGRADGERFAAGAELAVVEGRARALLAAERTALNFLQRLSGIATLTRAFVDAVAGTPARILDTRKTTPGLRLLERQAVRAGGGHNHRFGLFDMVLLKENHFALAGSADPGEVVARAMAATDLPVMAEARDLHQAVALARAGAAVVLLDNFAPGAGLREAVAAVREAAAAAGRPVQVEVSGGIRLDNVRQYAECGVDRISIGALTHSAPAVDLSLLVEGAA